MELGEAGRDVYTEYKLVILLHLPTCIITTHLPHHPSVLQNHQTILDVLDDIIGFCNHGTPPSSTANAPATAV